MGHFHHSLLCSKAIHIHFHSFIDLHTWKGKYLFVKRRSKAIFSVLLWKHVSSVAGSDSGAIDTFKDVDFLPGADTHVRAMPLPATSLPQGSTIGKRKEQSAANETRAKRDVHAFSKNNSI